MKRRILETAHRVGYEIMRRAQIELSIMDLKEMPPIREEAVAEELERMDRALEEGCGHCLACRLRARGPAPEHVLN